LKKILFIHAFLLLTVMLINSQSNNIDQKSIDLNFGISNFIYFRNVLLMPITQQFEKGDYKDYAYVPTKKWSTF
jgi:hypothetical protein